MTATDPEALIETSWRENAAPWITAVRERQIESRRLATDQAIIDALLSGEPASVLDVGCGEGWLVRELVRHGIRATGVDATHALVEAARQKGGGEFHCLNYFALAAGELPLRVDTVVCNFSLLGDRSVAVLFQAVPALLTPSGRFIVQTPHPEVACGDQPYRDSWRPGSWAGFDPTFRAPAPWYFRTLESWQRLFEESGLRLLEQRTPIHPNTGQPASVIFVARPQAGISDDR